MYAKFMSLKVGQTNQQMRIVAIQYLVVFCVLDDQVNQIEQLPIWPAARFLCVLLLRMDAQLLLLSMRYVWLVRSDVEVDSVTA